MAKTLPQLVKIERGDPERVAPEHVEPYSWQRTPSPRPAAPDPWDVPTVRLPRDRAPERKG